MARLENAVWHSLKSRRGNWIILGSLFFQFVLQEKPEGKKGGGASSRVKTRRRRIVQKISGEFGRILTFLQMHISGAFTEKVETATALQVYTFYLAEHHKRHLLTFFGQHLFHNLSHKTVPIYQLILDILTIQSSFNVWWKHVLHQKVSPLIGWGNK